MNAWPEYEQTSLHSAGDFHKECVKCKVMQVLHSHFPQKPFCACCHRPASSLFETTVCNVIAITMLPLGTLTTGLCLIAPAICLFQQAAHSTLGEESEAQCNPGLRNGCLIWEDAHIKGSPSQCQYSNICMAALNLAVIYCAGLERTFTQKEIKAWTQCVPKFTDGPFLIQGSRFQNKKPHFPLWEGLWWNLSVACLQVWSTCKTDEHDFFWNRQQNTLPSPSYLANYLPHIRQWK